ncbi:MAG: hypothetical protein M1828_001600 [Chrysothrix sp. TS-e1954]|nr:MAG: hypothetical protein M1828_001600 [Chrysothrix sp. TS-e1954]
MLNNKGEGTEALTVEEEDRCWNYVEQFLVKWKDSLVGKGIVPDRALLPELRMQLRGSLATLTPLSSVQLGKRRHVSISPEAGPSSEVIQGGRTTTFEMICQTLDTPKKIYEELLDEGLVDIAKQFEDGVEEIWRSDLPVGALEPLVGYGQRELAIERQANLQKRQRLENSKIDLRAFRTDRRD